MTNAILFICPFVHLFLQMNKWTYVMLFCSFVATNEQMNKSSDLRYLSDIPHTKLCGARNDIKYETGNRKQKTQTQEQNTCKEET